MKLNKMMKDLQKMQEKMQENIANIEAEGSAGGAVITARMNGSKQLLSIKLSEDAVTPDDIELMEDLIVAAVNEAGRKVDEEVQQLTSGMTSGLGIPGL